MKFIKYLNEEIVNYLYHFTTYERALQILQTNILKIGRYGSVSLTRNKTIYKIGRYGWEGNDVCFVLDKEKLQHNYKIEPFAYSWAENGLTLNLPQNVTDESEEIIKRNIINISKYIIKIIIFQRLWPGPREYKRLIQITKFMNIISEEISFDEYVTFFKERGYKVEIK